MKDTEEAAAARVARDCGEHPLWDMEEDPFYADELWRELLALVREDDAPDIVSPYEPWLWIPIPDRERKRRGQAGGRITQMRARQRLR